MKKLSVLHLTVILVIFASCSSNEEPDYPVFMQPSSVQSTDANAYNQTFEYDDYGRIVSWKCTSNSLNAFTSYSAHYSYPDKNIIKVSSEEFRSIPQTGFEETIQYNEIILLKNGRASNSEGTYSYVIHNDDRTSQARKTYRLTFDYLQSNHLNTVEHLEVFGIGDEIEDNAWDNAWKWMNYLIWDKGNLKEYQDYQGHSTVYRSTKYEYSGDKVTYPVIIPMVINSAHHLALQMQGVFGLNSANLVKSISSFDNSNSLYLSRQYSYEFENARISKYIETLFTNSVISNPVTYTVNWTEK